MENVARKHQLAIARKTLKMSAIGARIMGGMTHYQAALFLIDDSGTRQTVNLMSIEAIKAHVANGSIDICNNALVDTAEVCPEIKDWEFTFNSPGHVIAVKPE